MEKFPNEKIFPYGDLDFVKKKYKSIGFSVRDFSGKFEGFFFAREARGERRSREPAREARRKRRSREMASLARTVPKPLANVR